MAVIWMDVDAALSEVPVNIAPLTDDTDFKTRETALTYDQAGMDLAWVFHTPAGATTYTAVTPTTGGDYDWSHQGDGMYTIEIPASGGASINNDTEGFGYFVGYCTGVLPWRGPTIGLRAAGLNDLMVENAFSTTRGLSGTALPDAAADAALGLPVSDAGGLDLDTLLGYLTGAVATAAALSTTDGKVDTINTNAARLTAARAQVLDDWINAGRLDAILDTIAGDVENIDGDAMRGTDGANTTVPDAAGTAPTSAEIVTALQAAGTHLTLIKAVTDLLPDAGALTTIGTDTSRLTAVRAQVLTDWLDGGRLDLLLDAIKAVTDSLNDISAADVNAQVLDVLNVDTFAQPGQENPAATQTIVKMIAYLYKAWRNKQDSDGSDQQLYADDGTTVDQTASVTESGGTVTRGEFGTGA